MSNIKLLCIHGIGGKDATMNDENGWATEWKTSFEKMQFTNPENVEFMQFDSFFNGSEVGMEEYWDFFKKTFRKKVQEEKEKFIGGLLDNYPDMVVEFLLDKKEIRKRLRDRLKEEILSKNPDVIFAHSLGGMMCYDFFTQPENNRY